MKDTFRRLVVTILSIALAVSPVGCGTNATEGQGLDEEILNSTKSMKMLEGEFSDILIKDEESAIKAASESAKELGYENALNELQGFYKTTVDGETYYRLRQTYQGIPVYGRYVVVAAEDSGKAVSLNTDVRDLPDSMNTQITVNDAQIAEGVKEYAVFHWKKLYDNIKITPVADAEKVIYDLDEGLEARACVKLYVTNGGEVYEVVADGETGAVRSAVNTVGYEMSTGTDGEKEFPVIFDGDETYTLGDEERNIRVFYFNGNDSNKPSESAIYPEVISRGDNVFGNTKEEKDIDSQKGVDFYTTVIKTVDYYQNTFGQDIPCGMLACGYGDMFDEGYNSRGGKTDDDSSSVLFMGANEPVDSYEIIGHEYTHCIQHGLDAAVVDSDPGIFEGIADIFGFFSEAYYTGSTDWVFDMTKKDGMTHRSAASPGTYNYPTTVLEENKSGQDDGHAYAAAISRIAYLMYESGKFSMDELQMIWYKTLCRLPHSASYGHLRDALKQVVDVKYGVLSEQSEVLQDCLNEVGLNSDPYIECKNKAKLRVYDKNREPYDDYKFVITGIQKKKSKEYYQEATVNSSDPYKLDLPDGTYKCSVTDNAVNVGFGVSRTKSVTLIVSKENTNDIVDCMTDFGADFVAAPGAQLIVLDAYGNEYKTYEATTTKFDGKTENDDENENDVETVNDDESENDGETVNDDKSEDDKKIVIEDGFLDLEVHNNYSVWLKNKKGNTLQRDAFSLRIKKGGNTKIVKKTEFVGGSHLKGCVVDSESEEPLGGVQVQYTNQNNPDETGSTKTDETGVFDIFNLSEGRIVISLSSEAYLEAGIEKDVNSEPQDYDLGVIQMEKRVIEAQTLAVGPDFGIAAVKEDGTVQFEALNRSTAGVYEEISSWENVKSIGYGQNFIIALLDNGTLKASVSSKGLGTDYGQCKIEDWEEIEQIAVGLEHTVGLRRDGTVVAAGNNEFGQCDVGDWKSIVMIAAGAYHTVGLKADGNVVATGQNPRDSGGYNDPCNVGNWTDITKITAGYGFTAGLSSDGTVSLTKIEAQGYYPYGRPSGWTGVSSVAAGCDSTHLLALLEDGTVIGIGPSDHGLGSEFMGVKNWNDIVLLACGRGITVGVTKDGTALMVGMYGAETLENLRGVRVP